MSRVDIVVAEQEKQSSDGDPLYELRAVARAAQESERATAPPHDLTAHDLAARIAEHDTGNTTWVLPSTDRIYPRLLRHGMRLRRCHDVALAERLLLNSQGRHDEPHGLAAAYARARGLPPPSDAEDDTADATGQAALFAPRGTGLPDDVTPAEATEIVLAEQHSAIQRAPAPERLRLLIASESQSALAAAEMSQHGLPWRADIHDAVLTTLLGRRVANGRPSTLADLADRISEAFGTPVNPDHPPSVVRAFRRAGIDVPSSRAHVLRDVDHPAVVPLLEYKELARLHSAHGWSWLREWVHDGRFRAAYVVGGVVSGRWATRGGGALQIPKVLRTCVRADPGWRLVVADAAQLEPRVLAALSGDRRLADVSASSDLYASIAADAFGGERGRAKIAMLSALYGGTSGEAGPLLARLRTRFPDAVHYVEHAAAAGERGELVRSRLGRTSPPPSEQWRALTGNADAGVAAHRASREWGRFTRNFVVQASAADYTSVLLALLRRALAHHAPDAELVFFQHDELIVHCPAEDAEAVAGLFQSCADEAGTLTFGARCPVRFPLEATLVDCYADAK
ncbi:bifunctional 3'-5' exonuclease/DNA polymerase [Haloechinothrix halophila]|uniref:bifunctional 3'-5' exonuclease/DNA polymerase n=1 Tax=Haloechinothrix halophila TaxID=1069073 RepID=UPI00042A06EB